MSSWSTSPGRPSISRLRAPSSCLRLRDLLRDRVPDYMVPGYLDVLPELPTMASGKVDRRKLPLPSGSRLLSAAGEVVGAVGVMEEQVRDVWAATFGLEPGRSLGHSRLLSRPWGALAARGHLRLSAAGTRGRREPCCARRLQQSHGAHVGPPAQRQGRGPAARGKAVDAPVRPSGTAAPATAAPASSSPPSCT